MRGPYEDLVMNLLSFVRLNSEMVRYLSAVDGVLLSSWHGWWVWGPLCENGLCWWVLHQFMISVCCVCRNYLCQILLKNCHVLHSFGGIFTLESRNVLNLLSFFFCTWSQRQYTLGVSHGFWAPYCSLLGYKLGFGAHKIEYLGKNMELVIETLMLWWKIVISSGCQGCWCSVMGTICVLRI